MFQTRRHPIRASRITPHSNKALYLWLLLLSPLCHSYQVIKLPASSNIAQASTDHKSAVIHRALEITRDRFGPYQLLFSAPNMSQSRAFNALKDGDLINIYPSPRTPYSNPFTRIDIPIRRGLLSYRLLLINKRDNPTLGGVSSIDDLKSLTFGIHKDSTTFQVLAYNHLHVIPADNRLTPFQMLSHGRFQLYPRGIHQVFNELDAPNLATEQLQIHPTLALYIPSATFVFVSPARPDIAERLRIGLREIAQNGELKQLLYKHFAPAIRRAELAKRTIIYLENPYFSDQDFSQQASLWYTPGELEPNIEPAAGDTQLASTQRPSSLSQRN